MKHRAPALAGVLLALVACRARDESATSTPPENGPAEPSAAVGPDASAPPPGIGAVDILDAGTPPTRAINGSLLVHPQADGWVMLGDGSRFIAPATRGLVVSFVDPSLVGPQDVTFVAAPNAPGADGSPDAVVVETLAQIDRDELWIGAPSRKSTFVVAFEGPLAAPQRSALVAKTQVTVLTEQKGFGRSELQTILSAPSSFNVGIYWSEPCAAVDVLAQELTETGLILRTGMTHVSSIPPMPDGGAIATVAAGGIVLDHVVDQPVTIDVRGTSMFATADVSLDYAKGRARFTTSSRAADSAVATIHGIETTGAFAGYKPLVHVVAQSAGSEVDVQRAPTSPVPTVIELPAPASHPALTSPASQVGGVVPTISLSPGRKISWKNVDPTAQLVTANVFVDRWSSTEASMSWTVRAPATQSEFTYFKLPPAVGAHRFFPTGRASFSLEENVYDGLLVTDVFGAASEHAESRKAEAAGRTVRTHGALVAP